VLLIVTQGVENSKLLLQLTADALSSVPQLPIHDVPQRLSGDIAREIVQEQVDGAAVVLRRRTGVVTRDDDVLHLPQW
jgi:hypothetical protein